MYLPAGSWVTSDLSVALLGFEDPESTDLDPLALGEHTRDVLKEKVYDDGDVLFGNPWTYLPLDFLHYIRLTYTHEAPPFFLRRGGVSPVS